MDALSACKKFFKGGLTNRELPPKCPFTAALDRMVWLVWQPKGTDAGLFPEGRGYQASGMFVGWFFDIVGLDEGTCGRRLVCVPCKVVRAR